MNIYGYIDARSGTILYESQIINSDNYSWLKNLLMINKNHSVMKEQLDNITENQKTFLSSSLYNELYITASNEWQIDHIEDCGEKLACSLCGQKDTQKKYYIKNKFNNKMLNVGSSCINNFRDIRDVNGKTATQLNKEWERQQRKKALNDKYPGIINKIDDWNEKFEKIPTVVKGDIEIKYDKLYSEIKKEYKKFMRSSKIENGIAEKINELVCEGEKIINEVYNNIDKKKNNEWYITKEIKDWCYRDREKNKVTIDFLKQDGIINWKSSCRIYEKNLVNKIIEKLKLKFNGVSQILIQRYNESNNTIVINIVDGNRYVAGINLECQYNCFLSEFGNVIFEGEGYTNEKNFVIRNSKIIDRFSINKAILNFRYLLDKNNVKIYKWDIEYNEIAFLDDDKFIIVGAKEFVNNFRMCTFKRILSQEDVNNILKYLKNSGKKIGKEEYQNTIETREKSDRAMQTDYNKFV